MGHPLLDNRQPIQRHDRPGQPTGRAWFTKNAPQSLRLWDPAELLRIMCLIESGACHYEFPNRDENRFLQTAVEWIRFRSLTVEDMDDLLRNTVAAIVLRS